MGKFQDDDIGYQTNFPGPGRVARSATKLNNEQEYSTLKIVEEHLGLGLEGLYKDFNAFDLTELKKLPTKEATEVLLRQIEAKQIAYDILKPIYDTVSEAIRKVDNR